MTTTAVGHGVSVPDGAQVGVVALVAELAGAEQYLMVAVTVDAERALEVRAAVRALLDGQGLWCGPGAATVRCRTGLVELAVSGGVRADVVEASGFDAPTEARAKCLAVGGGSLTPPAQTAW